MMRTWLLRISVWTGAITAVLGALSFIGWLTADQEMARLWLSGAPLKPNGGLALILLGGSLALLALAHEKQRDGLFLAGKIAAALAAGIGAVSLLEHWTGAGLALDTLFIPDGMLLRPSVWDVRMSKLSAFTLMLVGAGLGIGRSRGMKYSKFGDIAFSISAAFTLIGTFSYAFGALPIGGLGHALQVPLPAVSLAFLLSICGILLNPRSRLVQPFVARAAGGQLIARMLPFVIIVPFALGSLHITQMLSPENAAMQAALAAAMTAIIFALVIWKAADELNLLDAQRQQADSERSALERSAERDAARSATEIEIRIATQAANNELTELTERQRQTEAFFSGALNSAPLGFIFWDRNLRIIRLNSLIARLNGQDPRHFVGRRVEDVAPSFAPQITPVLRKILETGQPAPNVEILRNSDIDPDVQRLNGMFYPVTGSAGEIIGIVAVISDVTREYARESALIETNERYRYVAKATNDAVWDFDVASNSLVWNESVCSLFGYRPEDVRNDLSWWEERVHPEDRGQVVESFHAAVDGSSEIWQTAYRFRNADNSYSSVVDRGYIIRDEQGKPRRAIGAMSDRTMQTALEESLRHSQKMDAVGRLSAGVAHDFNNVLAVISVSAEFLLSVLEPGTEHYQDVVEIKQAAERGGRLTKQLLAFTRQQMLSAVPMDLNAALDEMLGMLRRLVSEQVELEVIREPDLKIVKADRGQMEQVALNLVLNARDAMPDGGVVVIQTANYTGSVPCANGNVSGNFVTLTVSDTGVGMASEVRSRIFEPFFTTKEVGQGTGLGLATVLGIVKQSGGEICVNSVPGRGSRFTVYLPALETEKPIAKDTAPAEAEGTEPAGAKTILLVEDDDALRSSVARILEREGYHVLTAENGQRALEVGGGHRGHISLVLTDARMPVMGGAELVRRIYEERIDTRVLVMSGYTEEIEAGMVEAGRVPFIEKPFSREALLEKVRSVISA